MAQNVLIVKITKETLEVQDKMSGQINIDYSVAGVVEGRDNSCSLVHSSLGRPLYVDGVLQPGTRVRVPLDEMKRIEGDTYIAENFSVEAK